MAVEARMTAVRVAPFDGCAELLETGFDRIGAV
jgi:hypothetical protein